MLYSQSRGANSVNSITAISQRMYQLERSSAPALLAYPVISNYDPDTSKDAAAALKFMYRQEAKNSTQEQSESTSANHRGSR